MVALHFNDFIYRITNGKPHLWGAAIFALYAIIREWAYPISTIGTTVVVIVLFLTYAIRQTTFSLYVYKHRQYDQKRAKRESEKQKNALAVDNANTVDPILEEVAIFMVKTERCYVADIQRKFEVGYNRAQRIMTQLERAEITTTRVNNQPRTLLVTSEKEVGERISKLKLRLKSESNIE